VSSFASAPESFATLELTSKKRTIENEICKIKCNSKKKSAFEENLLNHFAVILTHIPPISLWILNPLYGFIIKRASIFRIERKFERSQRNYNH
jgi:hypothetical protein